MFDFLKSCAEKDTLTSEDRKRLVEVATTIENLKDEIEKWRERSDWQDDVFENIRSELLNSNLELQCQVTNSEIELQQHKDKLADGRMVELPCKVGDKVKILCDSWGNVWNYKTVDYGKFLIGEIVSIVITKKQILIKIQAEHNVEWKRERKRYPISALGKTVFLTKEQAERALKEVEK